MRSLFPGARVAKLPRWARVVLGAVGVVLGVAVVTRPTTSLGVLALLIGAGLVVMGVLELVGGEEPSGGSGSSRWRTMVAVLWLAAGAFVLVWPGLTVRVVAVVVAAGLVVSGAGAIAGAVRGGNTPDGRAAALMLGGAGVVFGLVGFTWPDITLLVVAVVFGARLIIGGLLTIWHAVAGVGRAAAVDQPRTATRRWLRTTAAAAALVVAVAAGAVSILAREGSPVVDDFYAAPRVVPSEAGRLVRAEAFTRGVSDGARGWRILYTTTNADDTPALASGLVVTPTSGTGPYPVIDWAHGTTGFSRQCAPSLLAEPFESGALFLLPTIIENGWALVATDYTGLGTEGPHPYLIGIPTAHAVLDARRAASELAEADLGERTVIWGHSQGGGAALWAGAVADQYAPDLKIDGVAALAPAANLPGLVANLSKVTGGSIFASFMFAAYAAAYSDVTYRDYVRPGAEVTVRQIATRCLAEPGVYASVLTLLGLSRDPEVFSRDLMTGAAADRMRQNVPPPTITAPLLIGQGAADGLILAASQDELVQSLCSAGQQVDYRTYTGRDHVPLVQPDSPLVPDLVDWTTARLRGDSLPTTNCTHVVR